MLLIESESAAYLLPSLLFKAGKDNNAEDALGLAIQISGT
jgi:hypothetical protein